MLRVKTIRDFKRGDRITYKFPKSSDHKFVTGTVQRKNRSFIELLVDEKFVLKLMDDHLPNIISIERVIDRTYSLN